MRLPENSESTSTTAAEYNIWQENCSPESNNEFRQAQAEQHNTAGEIQCDILPNLVIDQPAAQRLNPPTINNVTEQEPIRQQISRLDSETYRIRELATRELSKQGLDSLGPLLHAYGDEQSNRSLEGRRRIELLTDKLVERFGASTLARVVESLDSADKQLATGARQAFNRLSLDSILDLAGSSSQALNVEKLQDALKTRDNKWQDRLAAYIDKLTLPPSPEGTDIAPSDLNKMFRQGIAAAEILGRHSDSFKLSLEYGLAQLNDGDSSAAVKTLNGGLDRLLTAQNNLQGIAVFHAIDFRQQLDNYRNQNPHLPTKVAEQLSRLIERSESIQNQLILKQQKTPTPTPTPSP